MFVKLRKGTKTVGVLKNEACTHRVSWVGVGEFFKIAPLRNPACLGRSVAVPRQEPAGCPGSLPPRLVHFCPALGVQLSMYCCIRSCQGHPTPPCTTHQPSSVCVSRRCSKIWKCGICFRPENALASTTNLNTHRIRSVTVLLFH